MAGAAIGTILGVFNFIQGVRQRRVRLRVRPKVVSVRQGHCFYNSNELVPNSVPCLEVVNLSAFPVTISEVGFTLSGDKGRATLVPGLPRNLPCRLEPRQSVVIHASEKMALPRNIKSAYAMTECDETRLGDSPVLKKLRNLNKVSG
ncbi:MAG TPA: hypothetical protein VH302_00010 [Bryobacteraceae bacterium]|jgi:hypothetical protein|nr:hypothetical protein [Bryobacteraceae bacterium]